MTIEQISLRDTVHLRVRCNDWESVRSTVRMPLESNAEEQHETLGCIMNFPALTSGQWEFLKPELDRLGIAYDYLDHARADAQWVLRLTAQRD
jgi:hypothetical protein